MRVMKVMEAAWIMQVIAGLECHDVIEVIGHKGSTYSGKVYKTKKVVLLQVL
jgi:hypothetical protein